MTTFQTLLTGGGLAALGGLLSGLVTNWLGDKRDRRRYEHDRVMAREARRQQRLEQAYLELLAFVADQAKWAHSIRWQTRPLTDPDPFPREVLNRTEALVEAYGSEEVRLLLVEWHERGNRLEDAGATIRRAKTSAGPDQQQKEEASRELEALPSYEEAMTDAAEAIRERVRQELAGKV